MLHNADASRDQWSAWVNPLALRRLARDTSTLTAPIDERLAGAIVLFDISGFTALAEELAKAGPIGAERLKERLDSCFGAVTTRVHQHGGVVLTYPGDGVLALWAGASADGVADQAMHAATCCLDAVARFNASNDAALQLRAGLAAGSVDVFCVGGVADRWEWFVSGDPVRSAGAAVAAATAGQVIIDAAARSMLGNRAQCVPAAGGMHRLTRVSDAPSIPPVSAIDELGRFDVETLRPFISAPVLAHLDAGQAEWLAAFRPATVMFVRLGDEAGHTWQLDTLHGVMCAVQSVVTHYGGNVNQALIDDKGTVVVAGWGLAMHVHEDDAARAVEAALNVTVALQELQCPVAVGIASGRIFTGIRGSRERREYAMIGDVVNLAARLMQEGAGITCDDRTRAAARQRFVFEKRPAVTVKGKSAPVAIYRPLRARGDGRGDLVGRDRELAMLLERTRSLELQNVRLNADTTAVAGRCRPRGRTGYRQVAIECGVAGARAGHEPADDRRAWSSSRTFLVIPCVAPRLFASAASRRDAGRRPRAGGRSTRGRARLCRARAAAQRRLSAWLRRDGCDAADVRAGCCGNGPEPARTALQRRHSPRPDPADHRRRALARFRVLGSCGCARTVRRATADCRHDAADAAVGDDGECRRFYDRPDVTRIVLDHLNADEDRGAGSAQPWRGRPAGGSLRFHLAPGIGTPVLRRTARARAARRRRDADHGR
jgi:class 3 adenylate cyclase